MNPLPALDPSLAVVYRRVSSSGQEDRYGLGSQATDCRRYARSAGLRIADDFAEVARSTVDLDARSGGREALEAMMFHGAGVLLVARRDRLARDVGIASNARKAVGLMGGRIVYADESEATDDNALFMGDIKDAVNAHERRAIVARLRKGRDEKATEHPQARAQGGKVPHGYKRTKTAIVVDADAAAEVRCVFALLADGKSLRKVAATMTTETGRPWSSSTVEGIAKRDIYKRKSPGRIIAPRIWGDAQRAMASRRKRPASV